MTKISKSILAVAVAIGVFGAGHAQANQDSPSQMPVTGLTTQPIGHYEYCKQFQADCNLRTSDIRPVKLTSARWQEMGRVNLSANRRIRPVTDIEHYQVEEFWTYPKQFGDCEDYAILKRQMLMQKGWPAATLLITVVRQRNGDGHAVLTVRTDRGDYILDNLRDGILPWNRTEYRYVKRQSARNSGQWEGIQDSREEAVGSVD